MMQQMDDTWNPHMKLEFFKVCVRTTMSALGQKTLPVVFLGSLAMKPSGILRVLGLGAFFRLVNYPLLFVGS